MLLTSNKFVICAKYTLHILQEGSFFYIYTKFEANSLIHSKVIMGVPQFRKWVM